MGWTDDEIEHFFKKAVSQQPVDYQDAYWKEMEALLDAEKPAKKRLGWWFFGGASVLLILGLGIYFLVNNGAVNQKAMAVNSGSVSSQEQQTAAVSRKNGINRNVESNEWSVVAVESTDLSAFAKEKNQMNTANIYRKTEANASSDAKLHHTLSQINEQDNYSVKNQEQIIEQQLLQKIDESVNIEVLSENTNVEESNGKQEQNLLESNETDHAESDNIENSNVTAIGDEDLIMKKKSGFYVGADAGAGISYLKNSKNLFVQWGVKAGYDYTFAETVRLGAGIGYRQQIINDLSIRQQRAYYAMDVINVNQNIQYDRLQFLDLNVHAHYLFRKFSIGIEVTPSYLISARSKMDQKQEKNGEVVEGTMTYSTNRKYVRSDNFNAFGLDAGLSFQYEFKRKMVIELGVNSRLNSLLKNPDFVGEVNKIPLKIELGIIKRF